jgi:hypothetical protein
MNGFRLQRLGQMLEPEPGNPLEAEGVLNPAAVRGPDGKLYIASAMQQMSISFGVASASLAAAVFIPDRFHSSAPRFTTFTRHSSCWAD